MTSGRDDLFEIRTSLLLGNYTAVLADASVIKPSPFRNKEENEAMMLERDVLLFRAHLAIGQTDIALAELVGKSHPALSTLRDLGRLLKARDAGKPFDDIVAAIAAQPTQDPLVAYNVAVAHVHAEQYEQALRVLHEATTGKKHSPARTLELLALTVDVLLRMARPDLAERQLKLMAEVDDDAAVTALSNAWVALARNTPEGNKQALQLLEELRDKHGAAPLVLSSLAACHMSSANWEAAEAMLMEALQARSQDPDTLVNLLVVSWHRQKPPELIARYLTQLRSAAPQHPFLRLSAQLESRFDGAAQKLAAEAS